MNLADYLVALRRSLVLIVVLLIAGTAAGYASAALQKPVYTSSAKVYVSANSTSDLSELSIASSYIDTATASFADIATTALVLEPVRTSLKLDESVAELRSKVTVTVATGESVLEVEATDQSPTTSAAIAQAVASRLSSTVSSFSSGRNGAQLRVVVVDPAVVPGAPSSPKTSVSVAIGAIVGLVLAILAAIARELLDTKVRSVEVAAEVTELPVLGAVVKDRAAARHPVLQGKLLQSTRAEAFRTLRSNLEFIDVDTPARSIVITSSVAGEGKSTSAINLAIALADAGRRVLLVDADLRRPRTARYLGIDGGIGLTDVLIGRVQLAHALQTWGGDLAVLPSGPIPPNPNELLQSGAMRELLEQLEERYDVVILDAPPLLPVSDAAVLAREADGAIVVAAAGIVQRKELTSAVQRLQQTGAPVLGVVVTMVPSRGSDARIYGQTGYASDTRGPSSAPVRLGEPRTSEGSE